MNLLFLLLMAQNQQDELSGFLYGLRYAIANGDETNDVLNRIDYYLDRHPDRTLALKESIGINNLRSSHLQAAKSRIENEMTDIKTGDIKKQNYENKKNTVYYTEKSDQIGSEVAEQLLDDQLKMNNNRFERECKLRDLERKQRNIDWEEGVKDKKEENKQSKECLELLREEEEIQDMCEHHDEDIEQFKLEQSIKRNKKMVDLSVKQCDIEDHVSNLREERELVEKGNEVARKKKKAELARIEGKTEIEMANLNEILEYEKRAQKYKAQKTSAQLYQDVVTSNARLDNERKKLQNEMVKMKVEGLKNEFELEALDRENRMGVTTEVLERELKNRVAKRNVDQFEEDERLRPLKNAVTESELNLQVTENTYKQNRIGVLQNEKDELELIKINKEKQDVDRMQRLDVNRDAVEDAQNELTLMKVDFDKQVFRLKCDIELQKLKNELADEKYKGAVNELRTYENGLMASVAKNEVTKSFMYLDDEVIEDMYDDTAELIVNDGFWKRLFGRAKLVTFQPGGRYVYLEDSFYLRKPDGEIYQYQGNMCRYSSTRIVTVERANRCISCLCDNISCCRGYTTFEIDLNFIRFLATRPAHYLTYKVAISQYEVFTKNKVTNSLYPALQDSYWFYEQFLNEEEGQCLLSLTNLEATRL